VDWQRETSRTAAAAYPTVARLLSAVGGTGAELLVCVQAKTTICAEVPARLKPFDDAVIGILGLRGPSNRRPASSGITDGVAIANQ